MNETTNETLRRNFLDMKYARIIEVIASRAHVSREQAMDLLYTSPLFGLIEDGVADLHCRSDLYLAEEVITCAKDKTLADGERNEVQYETKK